MGKKAKGKDKLEGKKKPESKELHIRPHSGDMFMRNVNALKAAGLDAILEQLKPVPEKVVPVGKNINYRGIKNPLVATFIGFSTRKILDSLRLVHKTIRLVVIIEPDLGVFKHLLATEDISDLIEDKNVEFVLGKKGELLIPELFKKFSAPIPPLGVSRLTIITNMEIMLDPFVYKDDRKEEGTEFIKIVQAAIGQLRLSMGCPDDQFRRFEMMLENRDIMASAWNIKGLFDKFKDVPAIVLGGGPSLEDFIVEHKEGHIKNTLIIAADAVLGRLLSEGIRPHMVSRCERKLTSIFEGVRKEDTKGIYYCAYPWTPKPFFDLFEDVFYLFRQNGVCLFTEIPHGFVDGGVSAANAALEIAFMLGCSPIILSGADTCFIDGKTHVDGTQVEFNIEKSRDKWTQVKANDGKMVTTIPVWERCRREYMQATQKHRFQGKKFEIYNTSLHGAEIDGIPYKPFSDLRGVGKGADIEKLISDNRAKLDEKAVEAFKKKIIDSRAKMEEYKRAVDIAEELMNDAKRTATRETEKIINTANSIEGNAYDKIQYIIGNDANLNKLWSSVSDAIDTNFKKKLYVDNLFKTLVFDVLQLQTFLYENTVAGMINMIKNEHQRHYNYCGVTREYMLQVKHYIGEFLRVLR